MKVKVNDVELELEPGTSAIDAVFAAGYDVPYFCSQEYMSPIGACRMCLAKVGAPRKDKGGGWILDEASGQPKIFWFPNPMATCTTAVMEGMVIDTLGPEAVKAQRGMVELTLINHPLDCPTCDKGGACELQDRSYEYGTGLSRFVFDKRHQEKHHALSPLITLDRERCIHCKRCVRYFEEVPGDEVLDFIERSSHTYIGTAEGGLPSNFSGNITDICPVGALLDASSRFRGRNWEYHHTRTVSLDDASGSAITVDARTGRVERIKAALNTQVNKTWIDDGTRFGHEYADAPDRLQTPLLRKDGVLEPVSWEEACAFIAERLAAIGGKAVGVVLRADATLEEGQAAKALAAQLGSSALDHAPRPPTSLIPAAGAATFEDVATADAILVLGDVTEELPALDLRIKDALKGVPPAELLPHGVPIADLRLKERMPRERELLTVAAPYRVDLMRHAGQSVLHPPGGERELLEQLAAGNDAAAPGLLARLREAQRAVIVCGGFVLASPEAARAAQALAKSVGAKLMLVGPMANSYGLEATGILPSRTRGAGAQTSYNGYREMLAGGVKALILSNLDPAQDAAVAERLRGLELLVVHELFPTETARLAHVVLPAKSGYEKEGTVVNVEGRFLQVNPAPVEAGMAEDFGGLVRYLGEALGVRLEGRSLRSARRALKKELGAELAELPDEGAILPLKARRTERALGGAGSSGNALVTPSMVRVEYLSRNPHLQAAVGEAALRLHPTDAAFCDLAQDDLVTLEVGGLRRTLRVQLSEAAPEGVMLLPATPDQPVGLAQAELGTLVKERRALELAR